MKTKTWMRAALICGVALSLTACLTEQRPPAAKKDDVLAPMARQLLDSCTNEPIGMVDQKTGDYLFDDGRLIARAVLIVDNKPQAAEECGLDGWVCWRTFDSACSGCCADADTCWESCADHDGEPGKNDKRKQSLYFPE